MTASTPSAVRAAVDQLEGLLAGAEIGTWHVAYDHKEGDHSDWDIVWIRGQQGETVAAMGERYTMAPKHAEAIVAALNLAPHLLAAIKAVDELAGTWEAAAEQAHLASVAPGTNVGQRFHGWEIATEHTARAAAIRAALALAAVDVTETAE